jgi:hypothetical protein
MKRAEIRLAVLQAIDLLRGSAPGSADATTRRQQRDKAGKILESLPRRWWEKVADADELMDQMSRYA